MPEDFDPTTFDLEAQLRRYADHVEAQVGDVPAPSAASPAGERRWPIYLAVAAALLLVVGLASVLLADDEEGNEPADDPDVITEDDDEPAPDPEPDPEDGGVEEDEPNDADPGPVDTTPVYDRFFPEAPITPRVDAVVVGSETHVLVWGGRDPSGERLNDGAIFDLATEEWIVLADSPFDGPPVDSRTLEWSIVFSEVLGEFVIGADLEVATLDPGTGTWTDLPSPEGPVDGLLADDLLVTVWADGVRTADLRVDEFEWTDPFFLLEVDTALLNDEVEWNIRGDELVAVARRGSEGLSVVTYSPADGTSQVVDTYDWQDLAAGQGATRGFEATLVGRDGQLMVVHEGGQVITWSADFSARTELTIRGPGDPRGIAEPRIDSVGDEALIRLRGAMIYAFGDEARPTLANAFTELSAISRGPNGPTMWLFGSGAPSQPGTELDGSEVHAQAGEALPVLVGPVMVMPDGPDQFDSWSVDDRGEVVSFFGPSGGCSVEFIWGVTPGVVDDQSVDFEEGTAVASCGAGTGSELLTRLVHASLFMRQLEDGQTGIVVPAVTQLFADTAMEVLRNAGFEPVILFEPVEEGSSTVGRVIAQSPAALEEAEPGAEVTITVGEAVWQPISDFAAHRVVDGFLTALADEEWDAAAWYMSNGASEPRVLRDLGLPEGGSDWEVWIEGWCQTALCGADYELIGVIREEESVVMEVAFASSTGPVTDYMRLTWFEGTVAVDALPPAGVVGQPAAPVVERILPGFDGDATVVQGNHVTIVGGDATEVLTHAVSVQSSRGVAGGVIITGSSPALGMAMDSNAWWEVLTDDEFVGTATEHGPVIFTNDMHGNIRALRLDGGPAGDAIVHDTTQREDRAYHYAVNDSHAVVLMAIGETSELEIFELAADSYATEAFVGSVTFAGRSLGPAEVAPGDSRIAALLSPDVAAPYRSVAVFGFDVSGLSEWELPGTESFRGTIDFDGRWIVAPLESGRLFMVDTAADTARVVDVYAEVWFD